MSTADQTADRTADRSALVWRSVHVHRYGPQDEFLVDGVAPALVPFREAGVVTRIFFLRYWQGGHHIRIRLRLAAGDADQVMGEVTAKLGGYLAEYPNRGDFDVEGFREAQTTMAALESAEVDEIYPPDTIRYAEYLPEYEKYGGERGVAIAEDFFDRSSAVALDCLRGFPRDASQCSGRRLGTGFSMMLRGLCAAGLSPSAMAEFFAHYCVLWSPYAFDQFLVTWPKLLRERRAPVRAHVDSVLASQDNLSAPFSEAVRSAWAAVGESADDVLPRITLAGPESTPHRRGQVLLVSYLHTHNNRLGLIPEQEAFLGYLGHHVLSEHAGSAPLADLMRRVRTTRERRLGAMTNR